MRREVLYQAIQTIVTDLRKCGVSEALDPLLDRFQPGKERAGSTYSLPLSAFGNFLVASSKYAQAERKVADILGIGRLLDTRYWEEILINPNLEEVKRIAGNVKSATENLPKILELIKQEHIHSIRENKTDIPDELKGKGLLTVIIVEDKHHYSSPGRLSLVLDAVSNLYSVHAMLAGESDNGLMVLSCDSGSDKSFDFLGLKNVIDPVRDTIVDIWDRRVFYRHRHISDTRHLIVGSLPLIEKIEELKSSGSIGPEQAELMKRKTDTGTTQFLKAGVIIPELDVEGIHSPRLLMKPEPKLLVSHRKEAEIEEAKPEPVAPRTPTPQFTPKAPSIPTQPSGYDTKPSGYDAKPSGYDAKPSGYDSKPDSSEEKVEPDEVQAPVTRFTPKAPSVPPKPAGADSELLVSGTKESGFASKNTKPSGYDPKTPYYRPSSGAQKAEGVKLPLDRDSESNNDNTPSRAAEKPVPETVAKKKHPGFIWSHFVRPSKPVEPDTETGSAARMTEAVDDR
jgi:hypothetical protein